MTVLALLIAAAMTVWAIPVLARARTGMLMMLVLLAGTVFGPAFFSVDGPIQISLDRALWGLVVLIAVARIIQTNDWFSTPGRTDWVIFGFVAWSLVSCGRAGLFDAEPAPIARWLFYMAIPLSMYFVARTLQPETAELGRWISILVTLGLYLAVTAVFEMKGWRALVFPRFINDPEVWEFFGRGRGPLLNPAGNGVLMTVALAACVDRFFRGDRLGKVGYGLASAILLIGCYATLTRSVWLGAAVAAGLVAWIHVPRWVRVLGLAGLLVLGGAMAMGLKEQVMSLKRDKNLSAAEAAKSVELRPLLAIVAYEMFLDRPIAGHGYGHYFETSEPYHAIRRHGLPLENVRPYMQHNVFLSLLVDLGLIGLLCHGLFLISVGLSAWRLANQGGIGSQASAIPEALRVRGTLGATALGLWCGYVINGLFHEISIIEMMHMYLFFFAGLAVTAASTGVGVLAERRAVRPETNVRSIGTLPATEYAC